MVRCHDAFTLHFLHFKSSNFSMNALQLLASRKNEESSLKNLQREEFQASESEDARRVWVVGSGGVLWLRVFLFGVLQLRFSGYDPLVDGLCSTSRIQSTRTSRL